MLVSNLWPGWTTKEKIGSGTYGDVFEIEKNENGKIHRCAVKVMSFPRSQDDVEVGFEEGWFHTNDEASSYYENQIDFCSKEFDVMAKLKECPNIVQYMGHMVIPHDGWPGAEILIRMEYLTPLNKYISDNGLKEKDIVKLGIDISNALIACQSIKPPILHRDIKISNIMVDEAGNYKLGDFGITRVMEGERTIHTIAGTESYMAPEVAKGQGYGVTADIYSLGLVLYRLLNNNRGPFLPVEGPISMVQQEEAKTKRIVGERVPPPKNGSDWLKRVVLKALEYRAKDRIQTALEFKSLLESEGEALSRFEEEEKTVLLSETEINSGRKANRKIWLFGGLAIVLSLAIFGVCLIFVQNIMKQDSSLEKTSAQNTTAQSTDEKNDTETVDYSIVSEKSEISIGEKMQLTFVYGKYRYHSNDNLIWSSEDETIASVGEDGVVQGVSPGTTWISGKMDSYEKTIRICVSGDKEDAISETNGQNEKKTESPSPIKQDVASIKVNCYSDMILLGDCITPSITAGSLALEAKSSAIKWAIDDTSVATIENGVIKTKKAGKFKLSAIYGGCEDSIELQVVELDTSYDAQMTFDYQNIGIVTGQTNTVQISVGGNLPKEIGMCAYFEDGLQLDLSFGTFQNGMVPLEITERYSLKEEGNITVLLYDSSNPTHIIAADHIHLKISN